MTLLRWRNQYRGLPVLTSLHYDLTILMLFLLAVTWATALVRALNKPTMPISGLILSYWMVNVPLCRNRPST